MTHIRTVPVIVFSICLISCSDNMFRVHLDPGRITELETANLIEFTYADYQALTAGRPYQPKDGLLQFLYEFYQSDGPKSAILYRKTIAMMREDMQTCFPLERFREIIFCDDLVMLKLDGPQAISIQDSFQQAELDLSEMLVFEVETHQEDSRKLTFAIKHGGLRLRTTWLLRMVSPVAAEIQCTAISYKVHADGRSSTIGFQAMNRILREDIDHNLCLGGMTVRSINKNEIQMVGSLSRVDGPGP